MNKWGNTSIIYGPYSIVNAALMYLCVIIFGTEILMTSEGLLLNIWCWTWLILNKREYLTDCKFLNYRPIHKNLKIVNYWINFFKTPIWCLSFLTLAKMVLDDNATVKWLFSMKVFTSQLLLFLLLNQSVMILNWSIECLYWKRFLIGLN